MDYSMPDFSVSRIDERKMGTRLTAIIRSLEKSYTQFVYNRALSSIVVEPLHVSEYTFLEVSKIKILNITKQGHEIRIKVRTWIDPKDIVGKYTDITFRFVNGLSDSEKTNDLFRGIGKYVQEKEKTGSPLQKRSPK